MKRKQTHPAKPAAPTAKPAAKAKPATKQAKAASTKFAQPMRTLEQMYDSSGDDDAHEAAAADRSHRQQIDADNDAAAEDLDEDDAEHDSDQESEDDAAAAAADEADLADVPEDADDAQADDADDASDAESADASAPLELDLPVQLVQATYSGMLYGLKSKEPLASLRKPHSKRTNVDLSDDDDEADAAGASAAAAAAAVPASSSSSVSSFSLLFNTSAHIGSIKALAVSADGKWMVSGGIDETIKIFKTATMSEYGSLIHHAGSVSALEFYGSGFLLSGGTEGNLIIWNTRDWSIAKKFEGVHATTEGGQGGVSCIGVHPSGRVALSVGVTDHSVKLWDLMKGSLASSRVVESPVHIVAWSPNGEMYALVGDKRVDLFDTSNKLLRREEFSDTKILSATFLTDDLFVVGCEDKSIRIHSTHNGECVTVLKGHPARIRGLDRLSMPSGPDPEDPMCHFLGSSSTDGTTCLWDLTKLAREAAEVAPEAPAAPAAIHPICSSFHDQRVVLLRFLPQWRVRKDITGLLAPVQTKAAEQRQAEVMSKKAARASAAPASAASAAPLTKAERKAHAEAKSKRAFEKRTAALLKAKRTLAKNSPHAALTPAELASAANDANQQVSRKKAKTEFEVAPQIDSDADEPTGHMRDQDEEQDEDEEAAPAPAPAPLKFAASKSAPKAAATAAVSSGNSRPTLSAAQQAKTKANVAAVTAAKAGKAPATSGAGAAAGGGAGDAIGFSSGLPLFRPQLGAMQKKKKKSMKKMQRDAERGKKLAGRT